MNKEHLEQAFSKITFKYIEDELVKLESNLPNLAEDEIYEELKNIIMFDFHGVKISAFKSESRNYQEDGIFFRARKLKAEDTTLNHSDFWEAPKHLIGYGRLNKPKDQLLYVSPNEPYTPIKEAGIKEGNRFLLIGYKVTKPINVFGIGFGGTFNGGFSDLSERKLDLITNFIDRNFLQNSESAYLISSVIARDICEFNYDGWAYPSVANKKGENLCLKLSSKSNLEIHSAYICELIEGKIEYKIAILVKDGMTIYDDWNTTGSNAVKILNSLYKHTGKSSISKPSAQQELRDDIGYPINILE